MTTTTKATVKFNKYNVRDTESKKSARVWYSLDNHISGEPCVTLYAKDYTNSLHSIIPQGYQNDSDMMTDYSEKGRVRLFADHPLYVAARKRAEQNA